MVASHTVPCPCTRRSDGGVENDAPSLRRAVFTALRGVVVKAGARCRAIAAISVTGQRATVFCLDAKGEALAPGINWQDMRGAGELPAFNRRIGSSAFTALTGLPCNPVFTIGKWLHLKTAQPGLLRRTRRLALVNDFILGLLGGGPAPADWSSASLTGFMDTRRFRWSAPILEAAGLDIGKLPELVPPGQAAGRLSPAAARSLGLPSGIPLIAGAGDQQCAGLGAGVIRPGLVEVTLGTAAVPLSHSNRFLPDRRGRVMCCAHAVAGRWNLEGLQNSAGSAIAWMKTILNRELDFKDSAWRRVGRVAPGSEGIRFLPYLAGSAAPHWDLQASGAFFGLTLSHGPDQLLRSVLEGVAFETREIVDTFCELGAPVEEIRVTGGYTGLPVWNLVLAGVLGRPVLLLEQPQATLLGAAVLAAVGAGVYGSVDEAVSGMVRVKCCVRPEPASVERYDSLYSEYRTLGSLFRRAGLFGAQPGEGVRS